MFLSLLALLVIHAGEVLAAPSSGPVVVLDKGSFIGTTDGITNTFLGIPFAQPPIGTRRFRLPEWNEPYTGTHEAVSFGAACAQQTVGSQDFLDNLPPAIRQVFESLPGPQAQSEDCLFINVVQPAGIDPNNTKLPVAVWIYGGGFETGDTSFYNGSVIVQRSLELGKPVIYVSMNYRLNAFGFLPGRQVKEAGMGNLGLQDQRLALRWVQKYIGAFGGDAEKVTIWGQSAGSISVALHMLTNGGDTEGLFRGAFMQSGSAFPVGDITNGQQFYDMLVQNTGCEGSIDSLDCLRGVSFETLMDAVNMSPSVQSFMSLNVVWQPRVDGKFLVDDPQKLVLSGSVAPIPFVTGDLDDEGTLFSLTSTNITTDDEFRDYITEIYLPNVPSSDLDRILELYPSNVTQGSPFDTGTANALTPQFKRIAAFQGDFFFQGLRRFFLSQQAEKVNTWSFLNKRIKTTPILGSFHGSDIVDVYGPGDLTDFLVNFVNNLNPNGPTGIFWPKYNTKDRVLMTMLDGNVSQVLSKDTFREAELAFLTEVSLAHPL